MEPETAIPVCYRHPDRETRLACTACDRPVCVDCVTPAPVGQRCPECAAPSGREVRFRTTGAAPASMVIIGIAAALFVVGFLIPGTGRTLFIMLAQHNPSVAQGDQWWRVLSAGFLHAGMMHILFNMWALSAFGPPLERDTGTGPFVGLYLASLLWGGAAYLVLGPQSGLAVGASGAVFGLFGAWTAIALRNRHTAAGQAQFRQMGVLLLINAALPLLVPQIAWQAHLGGFLAGFLIALAWLPLAGRGRGVLRGAVAYAVAAAGLLVVVLA